MVAQAFLTPETPQEAVRLGREYGDRGRYLAGGTDLLCEPDLPEVTINLKGLPLNYIRRQGEHFKIGALTPFTALLEHGELAERTDGLLRACAAEFASWQIRNMATVGGNLASAVPSADLAPPLLALEAECAVLTPQGEKVVPLDRFFTGPHRSVLGRDLLLEVRFQALSPGARAAFLKLGRNPGDIATINVAALMEFDGDGICHKVRIALGAVAPTPIRAYEAEAFLEGKPVTEENIQKAAELAQAATRPISDQRASAAYRKQMGLVLTRRALQRCVEEKGPWTPRR